MATGHVYCAASAADITAQLDWAQAKSPTTDDPLTRLFQDRDAVHIDELSARSGLTPGELATRLLDLELRRVIERLAGNRYRTRF